MESTKSRPIPGHVKTVSVTSAPLKTSGSCSPASVISGMSAFLSACLRMTTPAATPFARAVRM